MSDIGDDAGEISLGVQVYNFVLGLNMNAAVHTSSRVHRCRDDVPGTSAIRRAPQAEAAVMKAVTAFPSVRAGRGP